ncbi:MAG: hypothetical protein II731_04400 [Succinivibrio sp.]|jgi:hypothetical protein|nr:hypothetical protein [Succinivibrio sp.]
MSIDASALTSIQNAISSFSSSGTQNTDSKNYAQILTEASASVSTETRFKKAFEEKLKKATGSEDVEISKDAIEALKKFNESGTQDAEKTDKKTSDVSYTYDYMTLKKQREQNQAKIDQEIADRYNPKTAVQDESSTLSEDSESAPVAADAASSASSSINTQPRAEVQTESDDEGLTDPHGRRPEPVQNESVSQNDTTVSGADEMSESATLSNV